jgi:hypothetical protein
MISREKFKSQNIQGMEKLYDQTSWGDGKNQNKDLLSSKYMSDAPLQCVTIKMGLTKVQNQAKSVMYSEKSCYSYQFQADALKYGHWPR